MKKVDFLFIYEVRNREIDSICLLGAYLESKGYSVGYVNTWESLYERGESYNTNVLIVSACYDNGTYEYFTSLSNRFKKVVNLQWEQIYVNKVLLLPEKTSWAYSGIALNTIHFCWGEFTQKQLHNKFGISNDYLPICGYIPLDFYREEFERTQIKRDILFSKFGMSLTKKTILFVSSFSLIGLPKSEEALGDNEEIKEIQIKSQSIITEWFILFLKNNPDYQVIYRPHPTEARNEFLFDLMNKNDNFYVIAEESIRHWIFNCDILCNWQSTSAIEMYASRKKTLILRPISIPYLEEMSIFKEGLFSAVTSYEEFERTIYDDTKSDFPINEVELKKMYSITETPAYERFGNQLIEIFDSKSYKSERINKPQPLLKTELLRLRTRLYTYLSEKNDPFFLKVFLFLGKNKMKYSLEENVKHYKYYKLKMEQNRIDKKELDDKKEKYKSIIINSA